MKSTPLLVALLIGAGALLHAGGDGGYVPEARSVSEIFTSKVVKVLSFEEGEGEYLAYVVTWRDHEVVVAPYGLGPGDRRYGVGDTIRCQMQQLTHKVGDPGKARILFTVLPALPQAIGSSDEVQRLETMRADIEARRARRAAEAAAAQSPAPKP